MPIDRNLIVLHNTNVVERNPVTKDDEMITGILCDGYETIETREFETFEDFLAAWEKTSAEPHRYPYWTTEDFETVGFCELCGRPYLKTEGVTWKHRRSLMGFCSDECLRDAVDEIRQDRSAYERGDYPYDGTFPMSESDY